ncbi:hypothetical protein [Rhizobium ruizarguesonis]|uniref:hypothetical protein n=1 Tax=Rhizobium ruizarguesonis TaxID=2081791 RepID=UPI001031076C|nr:hypothetical protein [Rhizobium ruizarguesonis]TBD47127.1 hypothetical protein ELH17_08540 [Rhizobium ruizarguesonis]
MDAFNGSKFMPQEPWFRLCGAIDEDLETVFSIGTFTKWRAPRSGILGCFANDAPAMYWNNMGKIAVVVAAVAD